MNYDVFLFTRDQKDYGWRIKPDYLSKDLYKYCNALIELARNSKVNNNIEWEKLLFFFVYNEKPIIARVVMTEEIDLVGRPIFSLEGLTLPCITKRGILDIPNAIRYIFSINKNFRDYYMVGDTKYVVNVPSVINPLDEIKNIEVDNIELNNSIFKKLLIDLANDKVGYSFVIGKNIDKIFGGLSQKYNITECYDFSSDIDYIDYEACNYVRYDCVKNFEEANKKGKLCIQFSRNKKEFGYKWLIDVCETDTRIMQSELKKIKDEVKLQQLLFEKKMIVKYLTLFGWDIK